MLTGLCRGEGDFEMTPGLQDPLNELVYRLTARNRVLEVQLEHQKRINAELNKARAKINRKLREMKKVK